MYLLLRIISATYLPGSDRYIQLIRINDGVGIENYLKGSYWLLYEMRACEIVIAVLRFVHTWRKLLLMSLKRFIVFNTFRSGTSRNGHVQKYGVQLMIVFETELKLLLQETFVFLYVVA